MQARDDLHQLSGAGRGGHPRRGCRRWDRDGSSQLGARGLQGEQEPKARGGSRAVANNGAGQGWGPAGMDMMDLAPWSGGNGEKRESTTVLL